MNLGQLESRIGQKLGDPNNVEFTTTIIDKAVNDAQERIVLETKCLTDTQSISIVAGTREYDLPTNYLITEGVKIDDTPLDPTTKKDLDFYAGSSWNDLEGFPTQYYIDNEDPDTLKLGFDTKPQTAGTDNCKHLFIVNPTDLALSASIPFDSNTLLYPYHKILVHEVVQDLLQGKQLTSDIQAKIAFHQKEVDKLIYKIKSVFKNASNSKLRMKGGRVWHY